MPPATCPRATVAAYPRRRHSARAATAALRRVAASVRRVLPHHRDPDRRLRLQRLGLCGAGGAPVDHRLAAGTGADRRLGRRSSSGGVVVAGTARDRDALRRRLAVVGPLPVLQRLHSCAMGDRRRALRGCRRQCCYALSAGADARDGDYRRLARAGPARHRQPHVDAARRVRAGASHRAAARRCWMARRRARRCIRSTTSCARRAASWWCSRCRRWRSRWAAARWRSPRLRCRAGCRAA